MIIEIFDKDEMEHNTYFLIQLPFDNQEKNKAILSKIKEMIKKVHEIDEYSTFDLKKELETLGLSINILYDCTLDEKKVELGF